MVVETALLAAVALLCQAAERPRGPSPRGVAESAGEGSRAPTLDLATVLRWLIAGTVVLFLIDGLLEVLDGASGSSLSGVTGSRRALLTGGALEAGASAGALAIFGAGTERVPGLRALRPGRPITWLAVAVYLEALAAQLAPATGEATVQSVISQPESAGSQALGVVPFAVVAVAAVGPVVRRTIPQALVRLGVVPLRPLWWLGAAAAGVLLVIAGDHAAALLDRITSPECRAQLDQVTQSLAGGDRSAAGELGVAAAAGISEELFFRGALQPRMGILLTSVLWASFHAQYTCHGAPSPSNLYIVALGIVLGLIRRRAGVISAIIAHTAYDAVILLGVPVP